jgi:II/X family phage/plasmid replication protein
MVMVDWISTRLAFDHQKPISDGAIIGLKENGDPHFSRLKWRKFVGSYETGIQIRSDLGSEKEDGSFGFIEVSGNPTKLFQGHNLWGTDDVVGLVCELFALMEKTIPGACPTDFQRNAVSRGMFSISRIDITASYHLSNRAEVLAWLRAAENSTRLRHRGKGQMTGDTLYFGKHSERWALKFYSKGQEVEAHAADQPAIKGLPGAALFAEKTLRVEAVIRSKELKRRGLDVACAWEDHVAQVLHLELLQGVEMAEKLTLPPLVLEALPGALRGAYSLWKEGHDLRQIYKRPTFYRYRNKLLQHGVDISIRQPEKVDNVVPLIRVLEAVPAAVPDWAVGTPLYFEPRRKFA